MIGQGKHEMIGYVKFFIFIRKWIVEWSLSVFLQFSMCVHVHVCVHALKSLVIF